MDRIKTHLKRAKFQHILSALAIGGITFAAFNFSGPPLFASLDNLVLFAQEEIELEKGVQVSSGDLGSNEKIDIEKDVIINGNLFADKITIDKNTTINGNVSFNKLKTEKDVQILGTQTKPVSLPIAILPEVPDFRIGTQDFKFEGKDNTLSPGTYRDIILEKDSRLTLTGGVYNLRKLELKENSTLVFSAPTTLNIQFKLRGHNRVSILPGLNLKPDDLKINYLGIKPKKEKEEKEDDDDEINSEFDDDKERKDHKERKIGRPVVFGKNSFLNFKLLAPKASVHIEKESTIRGQILARKVKVEKGSVVSREIDSSAQPKLSDIVSTEEGARFVVNQIIVQLTPGGTTEDANRIASSINGVVTGTISSIDLYQIAVQTATVSELDALVQQLISQQNPKIKSVSKNVILDLIQLR